MASSRGFSVLADVGSIRLPVRIRLTLWYTALLAGALLLFSGTVYLLMSRSLVSNLDVSLQQRINQIMPTVDVANGQVRLPMPGEQPDAPFIPAILLTPSGQPMSGTLPPILSQWLARHGSLLPRGFSTASEGDVRFAIAPIEDNSHRVGYILVWQSMRSIDQARQSLLLLLLGAGPVLLLLAAVGGMLLARRALRPVAQMTQTASSISATDLQRRVPVEPTRDELSELAATFNAMIARLEEAVERERRFTADASHELRSPLAVILAEASLALEQLVDADEYRRALGIIHEQAAGMQELVSALLSLARVEVLQVRERVPLAEVVERAMRQCAPSARVREVRFIGHVSPSFSVEGDATLLTRAVRNVLDNAIKASSPGGAIRFIARPVVDTLVLAIQDEGPGIAPAHLEKIFEPFYQIEEARTPGDSHGLGLAICRRILRAHGGEVTVLESSEKGTCFGIILPKEQEAEEARPSPGVEDEKILTSSSGVHARSVQ